MGAVRLACGILCFNIMGIQKLRRGSSRLCFGVDDTGGDWASSSDVAVMDVVNSEQ
jgi:hypothetical protein